MSCAQRSWSAVDKLVHRAWWSRAWVLQEVVVPGTDPLVICGERSVSWKEMHNILFNRAFTRSRLAAASHKVSMQLRAASSSVVYHTQHIFYTRDYRKEKKPTLGMYRLLRNSMKLETTDVRDKVFALVGLSREWDRRALVVDYSKSLVQVYVETAKHVICTERHLDILSLKTNSEISEDQMLSWVPDWRLGLIRPNPIFQWGIYRASNGLPPCIYPDCIGTSSDPMCLMLG